MRIKSWNFSIKQHRELIPRSVVAIPVCINLFQTTILYSWTITRTFLVFFFISVSHIKNKSFINIILTSLLSKFS